MRRVLCFTLLTLLYATNVLSQKLYVNGIEAIRDIKTSIFFATAKADSIIPSNLSFTLQLKLQTDSIQQDSIKIDSLQVDRTLYANNDSITVLANQDIHEIVFEHNEAKDTLSLVLTSLPLVSITRIDSTTTFNKDVATLTNFTLYDPHSSTNGQSFFSSLAQVYYRGATASHMEKKSFKVKLVKQDNGADKDNDGLQKPDNENQDNPDLNKDNKEDNGNNKEDNGENKEDNGNNKEDNGDNKEDNGDNKEDNGNNKEDNGDNKEDNGDNKEDNGDNKEDNGDNKEDNGDNKEDNGDNKEEGEATLKENKCNLLNIRNTDSYILDAASIDYSRIRNRVCFDLWNEISTLRDADMKRNGTKGYFCELILDGQYHGIYCLSDKINRTLLGLKKIKGSGDSAKVRGILYKCKEANSPNHWLKHNVNDLPKPGSDFWFDWYINYPDEAWDDRCWMPLHRLLDHTSELGTTRDSVEYTMQNFYEDNLETYAVFAMSVQLLDNMMHNSYLSIKDCTVSEKVWVTPWDMDASFGRDGSGSLYDKASTSESVFQNCHPFRYFYDNKVPLFYDRYEQIWTDLHSSTLSAEHVSELLYSYAEQLEFSGSWKRECNRWSGTANFWHPDRPITLAESLKDEVDYMIQWYTRNELELTPTISSIHNAATARSSRSKQIYGMDGRAYYNQSLKDLPSGIYIINGRKVIK